MNRSTLLFALSSTAFFAIGCASTPPKEDKPVADPPPTAAAQMPPGMVMPGMMPAAPLASDDEAMANVTVTVTFPDGRTQTERWGYGGGTTVNGVTNVLFKPQVDQLTPHVAFMLMSPVQSGFAFDIGPADGEAHGSGQAMLGGAQPEACQVATGTVTFQQVEQLMPNAHEVGGVMRGECQSMTVAGRTLAVEVVFKEVMIAGLQQPGMMPPGAATRSGQP